MTKFLEEVPHLLASYARPANTSCYSTWTCFLEHFLREGKFAICKVPLTENTVKMIFLKNIGVHFMLNQCATFHFFVIVWEIY